MGEVVFADPSTRMGARVLVQQLKAEAARSIGEGRVPISSLVCGMVDPETGCTLSSPCVLAIDHQRSLSSDESSDFAANVRAVAAAVCAVAVAHVVSVNISGRNFVLVGMEHHELGWTADEAEVADDGVVGEWKPTDRFPQQLQEMLATGSGG